MASANVLDEETTREGDRVELKLDGNLEGIPDYKEKGNPAMVIGKYKYGTSSTPEEFYYPYSTYIDYKTNEIYICDWKNNPVQAVIYFFRFLITLIDEKHIPFGICINLSNDYDKQEIVDFLNSNSNPSIYQQPVQIKVKEQLVFICATETKLKALSSPNGSMTGEERCRMKPLAYTQHYRSCFMIVLRLFIVCTS